MKRSLLPSALLTTVVAASFLSASVQAQGILEQGRNLLEQGRNVLAMSP